jgi:hypothetical protein
LKISFSRPRQSNLNLMCRIETASGGNCAKG